MTSDTVILKRMTTSKQTLVSSIQLSIQLSAHALFPASWTHDLVQAGCSIARHMTDVVFDSDRLLAACARHLSTEAERQGVTMDNQRQLDNWICNAMVDVVAQEATWILERAYLCNRAWYAQFCDHLT